MERTHPLINTGVHRSKAIDTLHDGVRVNMVVKIPNQKLSRSRYHQPVAKQRTMMGLGAFPVLMQADARRLRADYLSFPGKSIAPQTHAEKAKEQKQIILESIFSKVAANWFTLNKSSVTPDYVKDIWRSLEKDVFPVIG